MLYLHKAGFEVELDRSNAQLNKKIRNAQLDQWNYILVAGEEEAGQGMVDVRSRDNQRVGKFRIDDLVTFFNDLNPKASRSHEKLYQKVWDPKDFPKKAAADEKPAAEAEKKQEAPAASE